MNRQDAIKAMIDGEIITHKSFDPEEWIMMPGSMIISEDGCQCTFEEFWGWRVDESWLDGYSIFTAPTIQED